MPGSAKLKIEAYNVSHGFTHSCYIWMLEIPECNVSIVRMVEFELARTFEEAERAGRDVAARFGLEIEEVVRV